MTSIAYKDGIMCCDSCWSENGSATVKANKIVRLNSGALLGGSGQNDARHFYRMLDRVTTEEMLPSYNDLLAERSDFVGLLVLPNKQVFKIATVFYDFTQDKDCEDDVGVWEMPDRIAAVGSGSDCCLAVMRHGGSAWEAVQIACTIDLYSRPPIHKMLLVEPKPPKVQDGHSQPKI